MILNCICFSVDPAMESVLEDEEQLPFLHGTLKIHVIEAADLPDTDNCLFNISKAQSLRIESGSLFVLN